MSTLLNGLWSVLEFDNGAGEVALDSHTQNLDLVDVNTVQRVAGLLGNAAFFEAANAERFESDDPLLSLANIGNSFTFSFWIKGGGSVTGQNFIFNKFTSTNLGREWYVTIRFLAGLGVRVEWFVSYNTTGNGDSLRSGFGSLSVADWDLVTLWRDDSAGTLNGQINDGAIFSIAASGPPNTDVTTPLTVGRLQYASNPNDITLDNAWIWNRVLTADERAEFYNAGAGITYASIAAAPPDAPTALTATATASSKIVLAWVDNSDDEDGFKVERSPNGSTGWTLIDTTAANVSTYTDDSLTPGVTRFYRVAATNAEGDSAYTDTASATTLIGEPTLVLTETRPTVVLTETRPTCVLTETRPTLELTEL